MPFAELGRRPTAITGESAKPSVSHTDAAAGDGIRRSQAIASASLKRESRHRNPPGFSNVITSAPAEALRNCSTSVGWQVNTKTWFVPSNSAKPSAAAWADCESTRRRRGLVPSPDRSPAVQQPCGRQSQRGAPPDRHPVQRADEAWSDSTRGHARTPGARRGLTHDPRTPRDHQYPQP